MKNICDNILVISPGNSFSCNTGIGGSWFWFVYSVPMNILCIWSIFWFLADLSSVSTAEKTVRDVASILSLNIMEAKLTWIFYICHHAATDSYNLGAPARLYSFHLCFLCSVSLQLPSLLVASGLISFLTFLCICCLHSLQQPLSIPCT